MHFPPTHHPLSSNINDTAGTGTSADANAGTRLRGDMGHDDEGEEDYEDGEDQDDDEGEENEGFGHAPSDSDESMG